MNLFSLSRERIIYNINDILSLTGSSNPLYSYPDINREINDLIDGRQLEKIATPELNKLYDSIIDLF